MIHAHSIQPRTTRLGGRLVPRPMDIWEDHIKTDRKEILSVNLIRAAQDIIFTRRNPIP